MLVLHYLKQHQNINWEPGSIFIGDVKAVWENTHTEEVKIPKYLFFLNIIKEFAIRLT